MDHSMRTLMENSIIWCDVQWIDEYKYKSAAKYGSNSSEALGGYIGHSLSYGDYEEIKLIQDLLHDLWTHMYNNSLYGWDSMYTLDRYDKLYSLDDIDEYTDVLA
eukprot:306801_1